MERAEAGWQRWGSGWAVKFPTLGKEEHSEASGCIARHSQAMSQDHRHARPQGEGSEFSRREEKDTEVDGGGGSWLGVAKVSFSTTACSEPQCPVPLPARCHSEATSPS
jgi:hypothetical protein